MKNGIFLATCSLLLSWTLFAGGAWSQQIGNPQGAPPRQAGPQQGGPQQGGPQQGAPQQGFPQQQGGLQPQQVALPQQPPGNNAEGQRRPTLPEPFKIDQDHADYLDKILDYWEYRGNKVNQYEATFQRWEYDSAFGPRNLHKTFGQGTVKYERPDKGLFKIEELRHYTPPKNEGEPATYEPIPGELLEHWLCDGKAIYEYNWARKELREYRLPPEQQGKAIIDGPLPFLFGAEAEKIKSRYWLRIVTPPGVENEYWLEAWPKFAEDAQNFKFVTIIIDEKEFLPTAIEVADRAFDPEGLPPNHSRVVYEFKDRKVYEENAFVDNLNKLNLFRKAFIRPSLPSGWQRIVEDPAAEQRQVQGPQGQGPRQANGNNRQPAAIPR